MHFAVGDVVVYRSYGLGRVAARERGAVRGIEQEIVRFEFAAGLTVALPIEGALERLRAPAGEAEIGRVQETLREECAVSSASWLSRRRDARAKLVAGDLLGLAEIVRDGAARARGLTRKGSTSQLSLSERETFVKARWLLAHEIAHVCGLGATEADSWIDVQLTRTGAAEWPCHELTDADSVRFVLAERLVSGGG